MRVDQADCKLSPVSEECPGEANDGLSSGVQTDSVNLESVDPHLVVGGEERGRARAADTAKHLYWGTTLTTLTTLNTTLSLTHGKARPPAGSGGQRRGQS